jgi:uncharacterized protein YaaN involved in tellurite resistance
MIIDLNNEAVDGLIKSILVQDYKGLRSDITRLEKLDNKAKSQIQDLEHNYRYCNAMETLMEYYVGFQWKDEL